MDKSTLFTFATGPHTQNFFAEDSGFLLWPKFRVESGDLCVRSVLLWTSTSGRKLGWSLDLEGCRCSQEEQLEVVDAEECETEADPDPDHVHGDGDAVEDSDKVWDRVLGTPPELLTLDTMPLKLKLCCLFLRMNLFPGLPGALDSEDDNEEK